MALNKTQKRNLALLSILTVGLSTVAFAVVRNNKKKKQLQLSSYDNNVIDAQIVADNEDNRGIMDKVVDLTDNVSSIFNSSGKIKKPAPANKEIPVIDHETGEMTWRDHVWIITPGAPAFPADKPVQIMNWLKQYATLVK